MGERNGMLLSNMLAGLPVEVVRDADVAGFGPLNKTGEGLLHYFSDPRFEHQLTALSGARAILTTREFAATIPAGFGMALCENPKEVFLKAYLLHGAEIEAATPFPNEIAPTARIHPRAVIADHSVRIGANVSIGANAVVHERVVIEDDAFIGAGSVLGGDGFEVGVVDGLQIVVPHYGSVLVRRGAVIKTNSSVDWGLYGGCTEIGEGAVVDNLVHVAHNVRIGRNCQIIACVMIGGSTVIEEDARIGPNATVSNGLHIGRRARITLGAVVTRDVEDGGHVTGNFALPHGQFMANLRKSRG
jgi:UDP-3-O-[3-hydroxymyristoyl] glucosamine N-acyltransferase